MSKINGLLVITSAIMSAISWNFLPAIVPSHWNYAGQIDGWLPKSTAIALWTGLILLLALSFAIFPKFDPHKEKYQLFRHEWQIMQAGILLFFCYLQGVTFLVAIAPQIPLLPWLFFGMGALFVMLGNYLPKIRQNYFIGLKFPWTLADEENWNKTHRFGSWCFVGLGLLFCLEAWLQWHAATVLFPAILLAVIAPAGYSFWLFQQQKQK